MNFNIVLSVSYDLHTFTQARSIFFRLLVKIPTQFSPAAQKRQKKRAESKRRRPDNLACFVWKMTKNSLVHRKTLYNATIFVV